MNDKEYAMRLQTRTLMFVLLISVIATPFAQAEASLAMQAATVTTTTTALTLVQARQLALSKSPSLRKAELAVDQAALVKQAQDYDFLPSLSATADGSSAYGSSSGYSSSTSLVDGLSGSLAVSASATVFDGGNKAALSKKYDLATQAARESLRSERITIIDGVDSAFFTVLEDKASLEAAQNDLDAAKLRLQIAQTKADVGALSKADLLETESETASYETTLLTARKTLASAKAKLASLTGLPTGTELEQIDFASYNTLLAKLAALDDTGLDKLIASLVAMAKALSPTLSSYAFATREADMTLAAAKSAYLPSVSAGVTQNFALASTGLSPTGSLSLSATMSLDFWTTKNSVDQAVAAVKEAELDSSDQDSTLDLDVTQAAYEWIASGLAIPSSAKALEYAQSNYQNVLEKFKLSSVTNSDLSTAQALVSVDRTALISAQYTFLSNLSTLSGLVGLENEVKVLSVLP
jgi:outer membrane protein TolC